MTVLLLLFPIALLVYLMTGKNSVPSLSALPLVAIILYILKLAYFDGASNMVNAS